MYNYDIDSSGFDGDVTIPSGMNYLYISVRTASTSKEPSVYYVSETTETDSQVGYAGGGTSGDGTTNQKATQSSAGSFAGFGYGANTAMSTAYAVQAGAGGGGWYGGGSSNVNKDITIIHGSGGGSGFVNIAANAQYRPSGYTGIELDSGTTTAGSSSFPSTGGGTENGHAGNGSAKITRL